MATAIDPISADSHKVFRRVRGRRRLGVYVHFPWCLQKCPYCDFLSIPVLRETIPHGAYADAVVSEFETRRDTAAGYELRSVFFGGGTPSLWKAADLGRVLRAILDALPHSGEVEVTVECNPSSFGEEAARALLDVGVNRVSIGIQSLDAERLSFLGRLHDPSGGLRAIEAALRAGIPRVSADLIFGVSGQEPEAAAAEARRVADLGLAHMSAYALTVEPGTRFGALARKGRLPLLPEQSVAGSFSAVHEALVEVGFEHYEISNFARSGEVARHNLGYWNGDDYLGLGAGAWGTITTAGRRVRSRNTPVVERYLAGATEWPSVGSSGTSAGLVSDTEVIAPETELSERIMLGLRLASGVDVEAAAREAGVEPWPPARRRAVERLTSRGLVVREGPRLRIPFEAWLFADGTIADLM